MVIFYLFAVVFGVFFVICLSTVSLWEQVQVHGAIAADAHLYAHCAQNNNNFLHTIII